VHCKSPVAGFDEQFRDSLEARLVLVVESSHDETIKIEHAKHTGSVVVRAQDKRTYDLAARLPIASYVPRIAFNIRHNDGALLKEGVRTDTTGFTRSGVDVLARWFSVERTKEKFLTRGLRVASIMTHGDHAGLRKQF